MDEDPGLQDERALRAAVLAGDQDAWRALYQRAREPVRSFVRARLRHSGLESDDVEQQCWMIAVRRLADFDPKAGSFTGWLLGIAARLTMAAWRERRRPGSLELPSEAAGPQTAASDTTTLRVREALLAIPDHYRAVLTAKYSEGLRVEQIAQFSGQSVKAVESLLTRARRAFRDVFTLQDE